MVIDSFYLKLMEMYLEYRDNPHRVGKKPQIIGLTASPGAGENPDLDRKKTIDHLLHLAACMDATGGFKTVTENLEELQKNTKSSTILMVNNIKLFDGT